MRYTMSVPTENPMPAAPTLTAYRISGVVALRHSIVVFAQRTDGATYSMMITAEGPGPWTRHWHSGPEQVLLAVSVGEAYQLRAAMLSLDTSRWPAPCADGSCWDTRQAVSS